jgi:uncharacterized Zn-binding protein involved in type VI secretion
MRKALIVEGSPTTTGGVVLKGSAIGMTDHGVTFALDGDKATCPVCKGSFPIKGTAKRRTYRGRPGVLEGDRVMCPCDQNKVKALPNASCFYDDEGNGASAVAGALAGASSGVSSFAHDELEHYFEIVDASTGTPIEGMTYKLLSDGVSLADDALLEAGKTMAFLRNDHPNLSLVAWRTGDVR